MKIPKHYAHKNKSFLQIMKANFENPNHNYICDNLNCCDCFILERMKGLLTCGIDNYDEDDILAAVNQTLKELEDDTIKKR